MILPFALLLFVAAKIEIASATTPQCQQEARDSKPFTLYTDIADLDLTGPLVWCFNSRIIYNSDYNPPLLFDDFTFDQSHPWEGFRIRKVQLYHAGTYELFSSENVAWSCNLKVLNYDAPIFNHIKFIDGEARRPSGSDGGFVEGMDKFVIEFSFSRKPGDAEKDPSKIIYISRMLSFLGNNFWLPVPYSCIFDVRLCPEVPGTNDCYCKNVTGNKYTFVYNATAKFANSGADVSFFWGKARTKLVTLPIVCKRAKMLLNSLDDIKNTAGGRIYMVKKRPGTTALNFTVKNLVAPYSITIRIDDNVASKSSNTSVIAVPVPDSSVKQVISLSYKESSKTGCGRKWSFSMVCLPRPALRKSTRRKQLSPKKKKGTKSSFKVGAPPMFIG